MESYDSGHFYLSLNASQSQSQHRLPHSVAKVKSLLRDYPDGFTANAIRNLLGTFHFYNQSPDESLLYFQQVLENDKENLNALSNQIFVYKQLLRTHKSEETRSKIEDVSRTCKYLQNSVIQHAECGFAYLFDCYLNDKRPRWKKCSDMFEFALEKLDKMENFDPLISLEIKFWAMQCYQKRYETDVRDRNAEETFIKAIRIIDGLIRKINSNEMMEFIKRTNIRSIAGVTWAYLGTFFFKNPTAKWNEKGLLEVGTEIPTIVQQLGLIDEFKSPRICFEKALKENENNCEIRIRFANYLKSILIDESSATAENRLRLNEAMEHLNFSLKIDDSESNWFGRTMRGQLYLTLYRVFKEKNDLALALADLELAVKFNQNSRNLKDLAEAYQSMALKDGSTDLLDLNKDEFITKASIYFWKAVQILGTEKNPEIHRAHGRFLRRLGDKREAIECFKRAMEIDTAHKPTKSFEHLFQTFLQMYKEQVGEPEVERSEAIELRVDRLLFEIAFWFRFAVKKYEVLKHMNIYSSSRDQKQISRSYSVQVDVGHVASTQDFKAHEAADLFLKHTKQFIKDYKLGMAHMCAYFETLTGNNSIEISKMIKQSFGYSILNGEEIYKLEEDVEWINFKDKWSKRRSKLSIGLTSCPTCGNLTDKIGFSDPPLKARNEKYQYDFYVIYPENQREWVLYSLLQKLEGVFGYKGSVLERDASPGGNKIESTDKLIANSQRVLAVLTREFYSDRWCMRSLDMAETVSLDQKRENFIIPILLEATEMPDRFSTVICLDVIDYFDWNKLVRAINQRQS